MLLWTTVAMAGSVVELDADRWRALLPPEPPAEAVQAPLAASRAVVLRWDGAVLRVEASWELLPGDGGWVDWRIAGPDVRPISVTLDGAPAPVEGRADGLHLAARVAAPRRLTLVAELPGDPAVRPTAFDLFPALRGSVTVTADLDAQLTADAAIVPHDTGWWTGAEHLGLALAPPTSAHHGRLAIAHAATGLTVTDGGLRGHARLGWLLRQGEVEQVRFRVSGVGGPLAVDGPQVQRWKRTGDVVTVTLRDPTPRVELDVRWDAALPGGDEARVTVPRVEPLDAFRTDHALILGRDAELEVVPEIRGDAAAPSTLPDWARGLVDGTPTAAWTGAASGSLSLFRFVPVERPPLVVDVADITAAATAEGRLLTRMELTLRNERASHLELSLPEGHRPVTVEVSGARTSPSKVGNTWRIPLPRSVETVEGLLALEVDVTTLGPTLGWRPGDNGVPLPAIGAPVAVRRTTVHLPPGWSSTHNPHAVQAFTEGDGIGYGFGGQVDDDEAGAVYETAVQAWLDNDFDSANEALEGLRSAGADNRNMLRLQANLDLVTKGTASGNVALDRRVREQAKSRAVEEERKQDALLREAEEQLSAGNYAAAESNYAQVLELSDKLEMLEQDESVAQTQVAVTARRRLAIAKKQKIAQPRSYDEAAADGWDEGVPASGVEDAEEEFAVETRLAELGYVEMDGDLNGPDSASAPEEAVSEEFLARIPTGRSFEGTASLGVSGVARGGGGVPTADGARASGRAGGRASRPDRAPRAPAPVASPVLAEPQPLTLTATRASGRIPVVGEAIHFQHLLLEPGAERPVEIAARPSRRHP